MGVRALAYACEGMPAKAAAAQIGYVCPLGGGCACSSTDSITVGETKHCSMHAYTNACGKALPAKAPPVTPAKEVPAKALPVCVHLPRTL